MKNSQTHLMFCWCINLRVKQQLKEIQMNELVDVATIKEIQMNEFSYETAVKDIQIPQLDGLTIVGASPGHSIVILVYCKTIDNMITFTQLFNSGELQSFLEDILNRLLTRIEPKRIEKLETRLSLDDEEIIAIEEITDIEGWYLVFEFCHSDIQSLLV